MNITSLFSQQTSANGVIVVYEDATFHREKISELTFFHKRVASLSYTSDVPFEKQEFEYLLGFKVDDTIDEVMLEEAVERLAKTNRFICIAMNVTETAEGQKITFFFTGTWIIKKIKVYGWFTQRRAIKQAYLIKKGEAFDQSLHRHSLKEIKKMLRDVGYHEARVQTRIEKDKVAKELSIIFDIKKGVRFTFGNIHIELSDKDKSVLTESLKSHLTHKMMRFLSGNKYDFSLLNRAAKRIKAYLDKQGFLYADLLLEQKKSDQGTVDLTFKVTIYQKRSLLFHGNRFFSKNELRERCYSFGRAAWLLPASLLAQELIQLYKSKGFWDIRITTQEEKERSFFVIEEGERAKITDVCIDNAHALSADSLKKNFFNKMLSARFYDESLYAEAQQMLIASYAQQGYLSCAIADKAFIPVSKKSHEYMLILTIDEGIQHFIANIHVQGYEELTQQGPFRGVFKNGPIIFNASLLEKQRAWLADYFQNKGFIHPRIQKQILPDGDMMSVVWEVEPGQQMRFGKTIVKGNNGALPFSSLRSLVQYKEGDLWNKDQVRQTFKALKELDIFESIQITPDYGAQEDKKNVLIVVRPDDMYEVRLRAGLELQHVRKYQTFNGITYKIGGTSLMRNPFNKGDVLRLDFDCAASHREIIAKYKSPLFLTTPLVNVFQVYSMKYDQPGFVGSVNDIYTLFQDGLSYTLERKASSCKIGLTTGVEAMKTEIKNSYLQEGLLRALNFKPQLVDQLVPFFFVEPTVMLESLDNGLNPTYGYSTLFSLKSMIPFQIKYKDALFFKMLFEQSFYFPVTSLFVTAFRLRVGHIFYRELSGIMPSERFYLGGSHSLRAYEADLAPPLGVFIDEDNKDHIVPRGGKSMINANFELRFMLIKKMGGVLFCDTGMLSGDNFADFRADNIIGVLGFGLRFFTPVGPLRFDIGWKCKKEAIYDRSYAWFLTFGQAF